MTGPIGTKKDRNLRSSCEAEREGFEPSVPFPVRQFSKLFLSASQASLRSISAPRFGSANIVKQYSRQKKI